MAVAVIVSVRAVQPWGGKQKHGPGSSSDHSAAFLRSGDFLLGPQSLPL